MVMPPVFDNEPTIMSPVFAPAALLRGRPQDQTMMHNQQDILSSGNRWFPLLVPLYMLVAGSSPFAA
jgi:hypothetical protein